MEKKKWVTKLLLSVPRVMSVASCYRSWRNATSRSDEVVPLASHRSVGREISYGDDEVIAVQDLATFDFKGTDIVLSSPGASVSAEFSPKAAAAGAVVIDNTSLLADGP